MNQHRDRKPPKTPAEAWSELIAAERKSGSKIGKAFADAGFGGFNRPTIVLYFVDETLIKVAKGQVEPLKKKLPSLLQPCDRVEFKTGQVPAQSQNTISSNSRQISHNSAKVGNPLQVLNREAFGRDKKGNELSKPVLDAAVEAEKNCDSVYAKLKRRTELLSGSLENTLLVSFNWRVRVGGTRGFRELLLPVFHPVFGIPYIPASSLKGAARAWARQSGKTKDHISQILGILEGKVAQAAKVEFLDAFPVKHCLGVDVATPQWHRKKGEIVYKPEPHPLLSLEKPSFLVGLRPTRPEHAKYVPIVKEWLDDALKAGIGSRVSSGYGRASGSAVSSCSQTHDFELWSQEMPEFRPTAIRGILRYWFRAVALSLYNSTDCEELEQELFGTLGVQGKLSISANLSTNPSQQKDPDRYMGKICLEATEEKYLNLIHQILLLSAHLGGVGKGSRRPLHLLNGRMRGCHWEIKGANLPLKYHNEQWKQFFQALRATFKAVRSPLGSHVSSPGQPGNRRQDTLDRNAQIWLLKSPGQLAPNQVTDWQNQGNKSTVLGSAMSLLYGNSRFKGENCQGIGNKKVGGALGTPSFIWIKSVFHDGFPYQVITIFGVDDPNRLEFAEVLKKQGALLVFGEMPPSRPISKQRPVRR